MSSGRQRKTPLSPPDPADIVPAAPAEPGYRIAVQALYVAGGIRAHVAGDRVPLDNVDRHGWHAGVVMPPPDPGPHTADTSAQAELSNLDDSVGGDDSDKPGRPPQP